MTNIEEVQTQNEDDVQQPKGARLNIFYAMFDVACNERRIRNKAKKIVDNLYINVLKHPILYKINYLNVR